MASQQEQNISQIQQQLAQRQNDLAELQRTYRSTEAEQNRKYALEQEIGALTQTLSIAQQRPEATQEQLEGYRQATYMQSTERGGLSQLRLAEQAKQQQAYENQLFNLRAKGLVPYYSQGQLTGFTDVIAQKSVPVEQIMKGYKQVPYQQAQQQQQSMLMQSISPQEIAINEPLMLQSKQPAKEGFFSNVIKKYEKINLGLKEKITYPIFGTLEKAGLDLTDIEFQSKFTPSLIGIGPFGIKNKKISQFQAGISAGILEDIKEEPFKNVALFGIGAGVGVGVKTAGIASRAVGGAIGGIKGASIATELSSDIATIGGGALLAKYGQDIVIQEIPYIVAEDYGSVGKTIGVSGKDIVVLGLGGLKGEKFATKAEGYFRTIGLKEVPFESITDLKVLSGEERFPSIDKGESAKQLKQRFYKTKLPGEEPGIARGFTATDIEFPKIEEISPGKEVITKKGITTIKSEFPGRYAADVVSPYFLRAEGESPVKLFSFTEDLGKQPSIIRSKIEDIKIPKSNMGKVSKSKARIKEVSKALGGRKGIPYKDLELSQPELKSGEAFAPMVKTEREIIIRKGTKYKTEAKRFYTKFEDVRVPIFEKSPVKEVGIESKEINPDRLFSKISKNLKDSSSYGGKVSRYSIITPLRASLALGYSKSSKSDIKNIASDINLKNKRYSPEPVYRKDYTFKEPIKSPPRYPPTYRPPYSPLKYPPYKPSKSSSRYPPTYRYKYSPPIKEPSITFRSSKYKKKSKTDFFQTEDLAYLPSFTARELNIKKKYNRKEFEGLVRADKFTGLALREIPVFAKSSAKNKFRFGID